MKIENCYQNGNFLPPVPSPHSQVRFLLKGSGKEVRVNCLFAVLVLPRFGASSSVLSITANSQTLDVS